MKSQSFAITWGHEHFFSNVSRNKVLSLFKGTKSFELYFGLDVTCSDVNVSIQPMKADAWGRISSSNGINFPSLNVPADPEILRELAKAFLDSANHIESMGKKTPNKAINRN